MRMDYEQSHQELVKCVVVGDTAVGKTRLICAKACNLILDLSQLMTTHIPTVWAIDQYRIHKEVLERSWEVVDGVNVSLRLWDTFGDHDKDRRFAYGRSDVVLLCFSIANPLSLRNCKTVWYPEIRKFCPNTPIVLVGCKNDLRYMFRDEQFQNLCRERSPFFRVNHLCCRFPECGRPLKECDILSPEQGRNMAKEINASYYETSVFTGYGVKQVFENVIRSALIARRQQRFLMTSLKHVRDCLLQEPFLPPKPQLSQLVVPASTYGLDIRSLLNRQAYTDVVFVNHTASKASINCHKIVLITASDMLNTLFTFPPYNRCKAHFGTCIDSVIASAPATTKRLTRCASDISIASSVDDLDKHEPKPFVDDSLLDVRWNHLKYVLSASLFPLLSFDASKLFKHSFSKQKLFSYNRFQQSKHRLKLFQQKLVTIYKHVRQARLDGTSLRSTRQSIISFGDNIPFEALNTYISLLYSFTTTTKPFTYGQLNDLYKCLSYLDFVDFDMSILSLDNFIPNMQHYIETSKYDIFAKRFAFFGIEKGLFSDVIFRLDDGTCYGHKAVLMARCEVMEAMFKGDFRESLAQIIVFPNVAKDTFYSMLFYIYTDMLVDCINHKNCLPLIELANRFCLTRLIGLIEECVVNELSCMCEKQKTDITPAVIRLLEPSQIHNADQLTEFCFHYITTHYNDICHNHTKLLRSLHPENQAYLNRNRWPPVWYLKELDYFERCVREREWQQNPKSYKRRRMSAGCFCFSPSKPKSNRNQLNKATTSTYSGLTYKIIGIM
ncbi:rho-related BTB domain containing isoform X1 [Dermatophagoides farinae]|uniref:rho-related BTB domain containing isoform X1 n=1 Tax=Dermatophagoides farinae TaxID=6954 RepID=UPI003F6331ED